MKHLISKNDQQIQWHENLANTNANILNAVLSLHEIKTQSDAHAAVGQIESIIRAKFAEHKNFKSLAGFDILKMDGVQWPPEISSLKSALERLKSNLAIKYNQLPQPAGFQFVLFDGKQWQVDREQLNAYNERFFVWANSDRYAIAQTIVEAMNKIQGLTEGEKINIYASPICKYSPASGKFELIPQFLK